ncbi:hypothetical protein ZIOFF_028525 [Zingiber officinale]|uniref:Uncharacterized protein n=1 Tax=Zingiber officinale TaxID=94328 RepID=A0A8J5GV48_ZINOF|nr:hypothetical protein ZIOFF_028525 [Zingiber officinale]
MKTGVSQAPGDYVYFKSQVPLHKISGYSVTEQWALQFLKMLGGIALFRDDLGNFDRYQNNAGIGDKQWKYYDFGPKSVPPLICIPGIAGTADVYYKQILSVSKKLDV